MSQEERSKRLEVERQLEELKARFAQLEQSHDKPSGVRFPTFTRTQKYLTNANFFPFAIVHLV